MVRKRTSGACLLLGGKLMCWIAKKQQSLAMSSAEAKYVAVVRCCANILWMKRQLTDYDIIYEKVPMFCDNISVIAILNNPVLHSRTKHIDIRYHFIGYHILKGDIKLHFIPTQYQLVDIFTKPLDEPTFKRSICKLALKNSKVCLSTPTGGILREVEVNTFRNAIGENYLSHFIEYVATPLLETVRAWFSTIGYSGEIRAKRTLKRVVFLLDGEHRMEGHGSENVTLNPTQVFSAWPIKAPKTSSKDEKKVPKGTKPGAKSGQRKKQIPFTYHHPQSKIEATKIEATKGGSSSKEPTGSKTSHSQATGGPTSLGVTSEDGAHPQLSSGMSAFIHIKPIYSTSTIIHSESASEHDVTASSKVEADSGVYAPKDSIPQTTGKDEGPNKLSLDNIFLGTNLHVLVEKMKSTSEGLETVLTPPTIGKGDNNIAKEIKEEFNTSPDLSNSNDALKGIKLEDLSKLVQDVGVEFMNLDSPKDNEPIIVQDDSDEEVHAEKVQTEEPKETVDALAPHPSSRNSIQIQELTNQVLLLQSQNSKLKKEKTQAEAEVAPLSVQPSFLNFNDLSKEIKELKKYVEKLEVELPGDLKEILNRLENLLQLSPLLPLNPPNGSPQYEGELIKKDKGKKVMSSKDAEEEGIDSKSDDANLTGSRKLKDLAKADMAKQEVVLGKEELVDLLGIDVASDLHLGEWREVVKACPNRKGVGWSTIYEKIKTRMDYLYKTEVELGIHLDKPLGEQDPLDTLNDLARYKRKHADDIYDLFRLHQGPGLDDHAKTFSSLLLAEVDKRNLNPLKKMTVIKQLRQ
ncbi:hypothetical protein Tco_0690996 [Tanacetum coccineum]